MSFHVGNCIFLQMQFCSNLAVKAKHMLGYSSSEPATSSETEEMLLGSMQTLPKHQIYIEVSKFHKTKSQSTIYDNINLCLLLMERNPAPPETYKNLGNHGDQLPTSTASPDSHHPRPFLQASEPWPWHLSPRKAREPPPPPRCLVPHRPWVAPTSGACRWGGCWHYWDWG